MEDWKTNNLVGSKIFLFKWRFTHATDYQMVLSSANNTTHRWVNKILYRTDYIKTMCGVYGWWMLMFLIVKLVLQWTCLLMSMPRFQQPTNIYFGMFPWRVIVMLGRCGSASSLIRICIVVSGSWSCGFQNFDTCGRATHLTSLISHHTYLTAHLIPLKDARLHMWGYPVLVCFLNSFKFLKIEEVQGFQEIFI